MARLISDIVEQEILDRIDNSLTVIEFEAPTGSPLTQRVKFCSAKWVGLFDSVIVDGEKLPIEGADVDGFYTVTLEGSTVTSIDFNTVVLLPPPSYFVGTLLNTKLEWARFSLNEKDKLPFVWLVKPTTERFASASTSIDRVADLELWFVHWSDWEKLNADREDEAIEPLMQFVQAFTQAITANPVFEGFDSYTTKDFPKFATETPNGVERTIFDSTLSAVNMQISVSIFVHNCAKC